MVDKDLFLYDLAVVAILKNEGPYLKEWLDYHLMAGVDHFYLYDNESPDNQAEVAKPYVEAGLVTYIPFPGIAMQMPAYNDAINRFKFQARYMAFIDGDEFIYPKSDGGGDIIKIIDEILSTDLNAAGLYVNWQIFGSNGQEKADYSRGVLERFTRRATRDYSINTIGKTIATNPRAIDSCDHPHYVNYFKGLYLINEKGNTVIVPYSKPVSVDKIALYHYVIKSKEEAAKKYSGIRADTGKSKTPYMKHDRNDEFDDSILTYRDARAKVYQPPKPRSADDLIKALERNLPLDAPPDFYAGKMETFLTCRAVASYLKTKFVDDELAKSFEEASLRAILKSLDKMSLADTQLLIRELPKLFNLSYPVAKELLGGIVQQIPQMLKNFHLSGKEEWFIKLYNSKDFLSEIFNINQDKFTFKQDLKLVPKNSVQIPEKFKNYITARMDIKLVSTEGDFQILSLSDENATVMKPSWLQKDGVGYQIQSYAGNLEVIAKSTVDGKIKMTLLGIDVRDSENKRIPHWVDYTKFTVNENVILNKLIPAWHNKSYNHAVDTKAGEEIKIQVEWLPHRSNN